MRGGHLILAGLLILALGTGAVAAVVDAVGDDDQEGVDVSQLAEDEDGIPPFLTGDKELPPGLAKREALPPGLAKKLGDNMPPGQAKKDGDWVPPGQAKKGSGSDDDDVGG